MNKIILSISYVINLTAQLLLIKAMNLNYGINNYILVTTSYGLLLPFFIIYAFIKKINFLKYDVLCGLFDYIQLLLSIISIQYLTMGEYLTYRTCGLFFSAGLSYFFLKKKIDIIKLCGIFFIVISCIILLSTSDAFNIKYSLLCLFSSFFYSLTGFIIEKYVKDDNDRNKNFIITKIVSNGLNILTSIYLEYNYNTITESFNIFYNPYLLCFFMILLSISENLFYLNKIILISKFFNKDSGSLFTSILDIIRRIITFGLSMLIFNEIYNKYIYVSYGIMLLGCILYFIPKKYFVKEEYVDIELV